MSVIGRLLVVAVGVVAAGCESEPAFLFPDRPTPLPPAARGAFDPSRCGTVTGRVSWAGPLPVAPTFLYGVADGNGNFTTRTVTSPNAPRIDADTRAVAGAVVFLRGVETASAKPWDHPSVRVELVERELRVRQGASNRVGFVKRGDAVEFVSRDPVYHIVRGRGAAYFSLSLPDVDQPRMRAFPDPGHVALSSGAGYYWASADLFVTDHPYWATTDAAGRFTLTQVPAGRVEVVVWHPGWTPAGQDRDPETGLVSRMTYSPPLERARSADVTAGGTGDVAVTLP